jgi:hypothetical protein
MRQNLRKLGIASRYDFTRSKAAPVPLALNMLAVIDHIFADFER